MSFPCLSDLIISFIQVKKLVVEMYAATTNASNTVMQPLIRNACAPIVFLLSDIWTSQATGHKHIGERIHNCE